MVEPSLFNALVVIAMKIFLECSWLSLYPEFNTGIQRVVRHIVENFQKIAPQRGYRNIVVSMNGRGVSEISPSDLYPLSIGNEGQALDVRGGKHWRTEIKAYLKNVYICSKQLGAALVPWRPFQHFLAGGKNDKHSLDFWIFNSFVRPIKDLSRMRRKRDGAFQGSSPLDDVEPGDVLLLIDCSWHVDVWPVVHEFRRRGAFVVQVIYDLIPLTHPHFFDDELVSMFSHWFRNSIDHVDAYMGISKSVMRQVQKYVQMLGGYGCKSRKAFSYFYLGADFMAGNANGPMRHELDRAFTNPCYLMVSTLEPRKNHVYLLDAFERLWERDLAVNLCFVGRVGWNIDALLERINTHPYLGQRLFCWNDLNDAELDYCYRRARCLVFPSYEEGFGLPIVEGLAKGLPVMASDIQIHREIGGQCVDYFDLEDPDDLAGKVLYIEKNGIPDWMMPDGKFRWITWEESASMLLDKIEKSLLDV